MRSGNSWGCDVRVMVMAKLDELEMEIGTEMDALRELLGIH